MSLGFFVKSSGRTYLPVSRPNKPKGQHVQRLITDEEKSLECLPEIKSVLNSIHYCFNHNRVLCRLGTNILFLTNKRVFVFFPLIIKRSCGTRIVNADLLLLRLYWWIGPIFTVALMHLLTTGQCCTFFPDRPRDPAKSLVEPEQ